MIACVVESELFCVTPTRPTGDAGFWRLNWTAIATKSTINPRTSTALFRGRAGPGLAVDIVGIRAAKRPNSATFPQPLLARDLSRIHVKWKFTLDMAHFFDHNTTHIQTQSFASMRLQLSINWATICDITSNTMRPFASPLCLALSEAKFICSSYFPSHHVCWEDPYL